MEIKKIMIFGVKSIVLCMHPIWSLLFFGTISFAVNGHYRGTIHSYRLNADRGQLTQMSPRELPNEVRLSNLEPSLSQISNILIFPHHDVSKTE